MHSWVVVGTHGHQRVMLRSTDCWWCLYCCETDDAMHCNEAAASAEWKGSGGHRGRMQQFGARCPSIVPALRIPPTHTGEIPCLSRPLHISLTSPERPPPSPIDRYSSQQKLQACLGRGGIELKTNQATFPSSRWRGGGRKN